MRVSSVVSRHITLMAMLVFVPVLMAADNILTLHFANGNTIAVTEYRILLMERRAHFRSAGSGMKFTVPLDWIESITREPEPGHQVVCLYRNPDNYRARKKASGDSGIPCSFAVSGIGQGTFFETMGTDNLVHVRSHTKRDGTVIPEHYRTRPDSSRANNFSSRGISVRAGGEVQLRGKQ